MEAGTGHIMTASTSFCTGSANSFEQSGQCEGEHPSVWDRGQGSRGEKGDGDIQGSGTSLISADSKGLGLPSCGDLYRTDVSAYLQFRA